MNGYRGGAFVGMQPAGVAAFCRASLKPLRSAARINSFALAGMGDGELHVVGKRLVFSGKFFGDHVEHVVEFVLRFFRRAPDGVAAFNRGNVGDVTAVVIAPANDLIIEQRLHGIKLTFPKRAVKAFYSVANSMSRVKYKIRPQLEQVTISFCAWHDTINCCCNFMWQPPQTP